MQDAQRRNYDNLLFLLKKQHDLVRTVHFQVNPALDDGVLNKQSVDSVLKRVDDIRSCLRCASYVR